MMAAALGACATPSGGAGSARSPAAPASLPVNVSVLSRSGPSVTAPAIAAGWDLASVRALVAHTPGVTDDCAQVQGGACWPDARPAEGQVLVAISADLPCRPADRLTAALARLTATIAFTVSSHSTCGAGAGASPRASMWLVSIPGQGLPAGVTLVVDHDAPGAGQARFQLAPKAP